MLCIRLRTFDVQPTETAPASMTGTSLTAAPPPDRTQSRNAAATVKLRAMRAREGGDGGGTIFGAALHEKFRDSEIYIDQEWIPLY